MGQADMHLVDDREDDVIPEWDGDTPVTVLTQTTLSVNDTKKAISQIKDQFSDVIVRNDLCYATTNRQAAVDELSAVVDLVLVVGAQNSSTAIDFGRSPRRTGSGPSSSTDRRSSTRTGWRASKRRHHLRRFYPGRPGHVGDRHAGPRRGHHHRRR